MVVEGSRRARLVSQVGEATALPPYLDQTSSRDDVFTLDCLPGLRLKTPATGHTIGNGINEAGIDDATSEMKKLSTIQPNPLTKSETEYLSLVALARMLRDKSAAKADIMAFLMHLRIIDEVPISGRRLDLGPNANTDPTIVSFTRAFAKYAGDILSSSMWDQAMKENSVPCNIIDLVDGRLLQMVSKHQEDVLKAMTADPSFAANLSLQFKMIQSLSGIDFDTAEVEAGMSDKDRPRLSNGTVAKDQLVKFPNGSTMEGFTRTPLLPFANPVFDKHLGPIKLSVGSARAPKSETARIFQEVTHWHSVKRKLDTKSAQTPSAKEKFWALKRNQYFMAEMLSYAESLTNKALAPETITVSDVKKLGQKVQELEKENRPMVKASKAQGGKGAPKGKAVGNKTVRENINATRAAKEEDSAEKIFKAWKTKRELIDSEALPRSRYMKAKAYLNELPDKKHQQVQAEVEFYKLCALFEMYQTSISTGQAKNLSMTNDTIGVSAMLWASVRELASINSLTKPIVDNAQQIVMTLGLPTVDFPAPQSTRPLSFTPSVRIAGTLKIPLASEPRDFQLLHCGPYMDRNLDSAPDPRVPFEPDGWQSKVLDELDADKSVFVVAPTSAGKTFISFYAMERILRSSDDGVLVYVAPTKALVNQIAAEIQVRDSVRVQDPLLSPPNVHMMYRGHSPF